MDIAICKGNNEERERERPTRRKRRTMWARGLWKTGSCEQFKHTEERGPNNGELEGD
jgi:hypothetical protein